MQSVPHPDMLLRKQRLISLILRLTRKQNSRLKKGQIQEAASADGRKIKLLDEVSKVDALLVPGAASKVDACVEMIGRINEDVNELIEIEKENDALISEYEGMIKGTHINAYKKFKI